MDDELERKRLELEEARLRYDRQRASMEILLKRAEMRGNKKSAWQSLLSNPLSLAIVGGALTLITNIAGGFFTSRHNIQAEVARAELARNAASHSLQADLIKKFVEGPSPETIRGNLQFLVDAGLLPNYADQIGRYLRENPSAAPQIGTGFVGGVVGADDRLDFDAAPETSRTRFRGIGTLHVGTGAICTAFLVASGLLATMQFCADAAPNGEFRAEWQVQGQQPGTTIRVAVDLSRATQARLAGGNDTSVAFIPVELPATVGALNHLPLSDSAPRPGELLETAFYAADRRGFVMSAGADCKVTNIREREFQHLCDTGAGSSGAPLLSRDGTVVGIHFATGQGGKRALRADVLRNAAVERRILNRADTR